MTDAPRNPVVSLASLALETWEQGQLYGGSDTSFGKALGLLGLGISYSEVPAGKSSCPFHNHHVEDELFIVLEGEGTYRFGNQRFAFKAGDVLGAPAGGQDTAHQILNTGGVTLKYLGVSTLAATEVCEYPDSGKFLVSSRPGAARPARHIYDAEDGKLRHKGRSGEHNLDYWDGEPGA
ncbi:cupin domain-containing protein [Devosia oryziradicis]|uniref:Cupin domain-containing protein n=1 Tax=Devosia oryziradicis TaxID=2801335 RepID=A0ABX7C4Z7_9HYPH|nr:cupin domain-containing protein [Devosia oryziradicis]QQR37827.1 cupin domain-containing protein [Devosia oryziradicis]